MQTFFFLSTIGFAKILKKFDKTAGWKASKGYMNSNLKLAYFMTSPTIEDLIKDTEDLFIESFEKGHRRRGMAKLRIPDPRNQVWRRRLFRLKYLFGCPRELIILVYRHII